MSIVEVTGLITTARERHRRPDRLGARQLLLRFLAPGLLFLRATLNPLRRPRLHVG